jgi:ankyrin repeat protein
LPTVKYLVEKCNQREFLETPLRVAARDGFVFVVQYLFENGANLEARNEIGETALHEASKSGHLSVVNFLLAKGARLEARTDDGNTALHLAVKEGLFSTAGFNFTNVLKPTFCRKVI